ncbi:hypothetical protein SO802_003151 [Lithocarpus litseifolius]|uniref:Uncharacterized protein n=1 Tax=Lithocarpus litseifolius TaxID=425828 RepID=A0AAW2E1Z8_9ROSI
MLGEIPSLNDRISIVCQLWDLSRDVLVSVEPGTPHGFNAISQMQCHILWMEKRHSSVIWEFLNFNFFLIPSLMTLIEDLINLQQEAGNIPYEEVDPATYYSVVMDTDAADQKKKKLPLLILGGSWGRLIFSPVSWGRQFTIDVCRSTKQDGLEDSFEHVV